MTKFKEFINTNEILDDDIATLMEVWYFSQYGGNEINESMFGDLKNMLSKIGVKTKSGQQGLLQIIGKAGKNVGLLIYYAVKVYMGDESYKEKMVDIANTKITKADVINVLLKMDTLTLHAVTGPIHIIDAVTGWSIAPNIQSVVKDVDMKAKTALQHLKGLHQSIKSDTITHKKLQGVINKIKLLFVKSKQISTKKVLK